MYATLARYYDQIHTALTADVPFILEQVKKQGGPVLELGCGTGRLLIPLAEAGFPVTGVDNSPEMLDIARQRLAKKPLAVRKAVTLLEKDMRNLTQETVALRFAMALLSYNTLLHFCEAEVGSILQGVARLLRPGAQLLIDVANPFLISGATFPGGPIFETSFFDETLNERVEQWSLSSLDSRAQTVTVFWLFRTQEEESETRTVETIYYYLYPHQIILFLQQAGFRLEKMLGSYTEAPFEENSERLLLLARLSE
jgi:SAM-dependent methyltransferase